MPLVPDFTHSAYPCSRLVFAGAHTLICAPNHTHAHPSMGLRHIASLIQGPTVIEGIRSSPHTNNRESLIHETSHPGARNKKRRQIIFIRHRTWSGVFIGDQCFVCVSSHAVGFEGDHSSISKRLTGPKHVAVPSLLLACLPGKVSSGIQTVLPSH